MIAFIDSSVALRLLLGEPNKVTRLSDIKRAVVSDLLEVECRRTIDRMRVSSRLNDQEVERRLIGLAKILKSCERVGLSRAVLNRAQQAFPTTLGMPAAPFTCRQRSYGRNVKESFQSY